MIGTETVPDVHPLGIEVRILHGIIEYVTIGTVEIAILRNKPDSGRFRFEQSLHRH